MALKNLIGHKSKEETLKDFEAFIKTYSTRDFIYFFSQKQAIFYRFLHGLASSNTQQITDNFSVASLNFCHIFLCENLH